MTTNPNKPTTGKCLFETCKILSITLTGWRSCIYEPPPRTRQAPSRFQARQNCLGFPLRLGKWTRLEMLGEAAIRLIANRLRSWKTCTAVVSEMVWAFWAREGRLFWLSSTLRTRRWNRIPERLLGVVIRRRGLGRSPIVLGP